MNEQERFIQERVYLKSVTPATVRWYKSAFIAFAGATDSPDSAKSRIVELRSRGMSAVSVNVHLRCINAFWKWQGKPYNIPRLKEEQKVLATFTAEQIKGLIGLKPNGRNEKRCHALICLILDTGLRIDEARSIMPANIDFDNLLITVMGKGRKERKVPISFEGRKILYRHIKENPNRFVFGTGSQTACTIRNLQRDLKTLCKRLALTGVRCSWHTLRHTFAVSYLRAGGNIFYLSKILGHTSVKTTERYLQSLGAEDLQAVHNGLSILSAR